MKHISLLLASICLLFGASTSASWAQPGIQCVQNQLNALGFNAGSADGSIGPKTRAAAEEYRNWMTNGAGGANWAQPPLTALNGEFWCDRVGDAHPAVAKFAVAATPDAQLVIQLRGNVPARLGANVLWEKRNDAECNSPCQLGQKSVTFVRDAGGLASMSMTLPSDATRACINNIGSATLDAAVLYTLNGKTYASAKGGDLEGNGKSACTHAYADAKQGVTWVLTLK